MEIVDLVGYAGIFTGVAFMVPQVWKTWKTKSVEDLSWGMLILFFLNCVFWLIYGTLANAAPVAVVNGIALIVSSTQISLKFRYRNHP